MITYDVEVEFEKTIDSTLHLSALTQIWTAINALAHLAWSTMNPTQMPGLSPFLAYKMLFGPAHILVMYGDKVATSKSGDDLFGQNDGWDNRVGKKYFDIQLAYNQIMKDTQDDGDVGVGLIAHEIAHSITYADGASNPHLLGRYREEGYIKVGDITYKDPSGLYPFMVVDAGDYDTSLTYEFSADVIANLAVGGFTNTDLEQLASDWFTQNIRIFIDNMRCTVGGRGYACSGNYKG